jgi:RimJ/RimL family protein N-acetyltransferase
MSHTTQMATYLLEASHAESLDRLADGDDMFAALLGGPAREYIARQTAARIEGTSYTLAITDHGVTVGICSVDNMGGPGLATIGCWVGRDHAGKGYGTFGVSKALELAFRNFGVEAVAASASTDAGRRALEKNGFTESEGRYRLTRQQWHDHLTLPIVAELHPSLAELLRAELAAGNEVMESGRGWPDAASVFVRVKHPFRARPATLPNDVTYNEVNDPHWWKAEYTSGSPRHFVVY